LDALRLIPQSRPNPHARSDRTDPRAAEAHGSVARARDEVVAHGVECARASRGTRASSASSGTRHDSGATAIAPTSVAPGAIASIVIGPSPAPRTTPRRTSCAPGVSRIVHGSVESAARASSTSATAVASDSARQTLAPATDGAL